MKEGRDLWWHELVEEASDDCPAVPLDSEDTAVHPLHQWFDRKAQRDPAHHRRLQLCTPRRRSSGCSTTAMTTFIGAPPTVGWITGHSYIVYGPLSAGATVLMYEGAPNYPPRIDSGTLSNVTRSPILYTAPTAIRAFVKWGDHMVRSMTFRACGLLGTVGEGINPEAWMWYHK